MRRPSPKRGRDDARLTFAAPARQTTGMPLPRRMSPAAQVALTIASVVVIVAGALVWYTHYLQYAR